MTTTTPELTTPLCKLLRIEATDGVMLPALFFEATARKSVAIFLHGTGNSSVFYQDRLVNAIASQLLNNGISFLALNNRGAYEQSRLWNERLKQSHLGGMAYELIDECIFDIDGAVSFLVSGGYEEIYIVGVSTGANKACVYNKLKGENTNKIKGYVLIAGGDDVGYFYDLLGKDKYFQMLNHLKQRIEQGEGGELVQEALITRTFSCQSLYDIMNPDGNYNVFPFHVVAHDLKLGTAKPFGMFASITKPTLVIYGENDPFCYYDAKRAITTLKSYRSKPDQSTDYTIIKDGGHYFLGHELELAESIGSWLAANT